jgi:hypothetical protein
MSRISVNLSDPFFVRFCCRSCHKTVNQKIPTEKEYEDELNTTVVVESSVYVAHSVVPGYFKLENSKPSPQRTEGNTEESTENLCAVHIVASIHDSGLPEEGSIACNLCARFVFVIHSTTNTATRIPGCITSNK